MAISSKRPYPPLASRLFSVWYRHMRVYTRNLISNGLPPFLEPLIFLAGIGLGLGSYITSMEGIPFIKYLATGLLVSSAMFTAAFECSFGTFIRLEFDKVYDGMLGAPITVNNLIVGEILWAGTKGLFFSMAVFVIVSLFGILPIWKVIMAPPIGFLTGTMFASLSLFVTSFVKNLNHFNFYFTGFISPLFFFSGVIFPIERLPKALHPVAEALPLTHSVRLIRGLVFSDLEFVHLLDLLYMVGFSIVMGFLAVRLLRRRLVD
jgi:lipooligosaccharide transport system permease protein